MTYAPELGQMAFGQPWQEHKASGDIEGFLFVLGALVEKKHGKNPCENIGARFDCPVFSLHSYSWTDDDQPWNFRCGNAIASWYKYCGRGTTCNQAMLDADLADMLLRCIPAIESGVLR